jgi:hypothetical protein
MAFQQTILEQGFLQLIEDPPKSPPDYAYRFSSFYEQYALTATPTPVTTGKRPLLEGALLSSINSRSGYAALVVDGMNRGLTVFWVGTPVPGGAVTAFLGQAFITGLQALLVNPKMGARNAAKILANSFQAASLLVQYIIPPGGPLFLV